ncbi:MAG: glycosyltransferase [Holophagales bacterium]|nr:glycosyltransferase [Holophagales bacterium]
MSPDARPSDSDRPRHVLLAGGGSGGHVFPALAVGAELARRGWRVSFAGNPAGMEARLVPERGIAFVPLAARPVVGRGALARVGALATLATSALAARRRVRALGVATSSSAPGLRVGALAAAARRAGAPAAAPSSSRTRAPERPTAGSRASPARRRSPTRRPAASCAARRR